MNDFKFLKPLRKVKNEWHAQYEGQWIKYGKQEYIEKTKAVKPKYPCCFGAHLARAYTKGEFENFAYNITKLTHIFTDGKIYFYNQIGLPLKSPKIKENKEINDKHEMIVYKLFYLLGITESPFQNPFWSDDWQVPFSEAIRLLETKGPKLLKKLRRKYNV